MPGTHTDLFLPTKLLESEGSWLLEVPCTNYLEKGWVVITGSPRPVAG